MNVFITLGLRTTEPYFDNTPNIEKIIMGDFCNKHILHKYELFEGKPEKILDILCEELNAKETDVLVSYACENIKQMLYLSNKLKENNHRLHTVFIPSPKLLLMKVEEELEFTRKHANFASCTELQIEEGYQEWLQIYEEIRHELPKYGIEVKDV